MRSPDVDENVNKRQLTAELDNSFHLLMCQQDKMQHVMDLILNIAKRYFTKSLRPFWMTS